MKKRLMLIAGLIVVAAACTTIPGVDPADRVLAVVECIDAMNKAGINVAEIRQETNVDSRAIKAMQVINRAGEQHLATGVAGACAPMLRNAAAAKSARDAAKPN